MADSAAQGSSGRGRGRGVGGGADGEGRGRRRRAGSSLGAGCLIQLARSGELEIHAALVGRFYSEGLRWALALPLPELMRWVKLMPKIAERERGR